MFQKIAKNILFKERQDNPLAVELRKLPVETISAG
jgi:hypothetical protein